MLAHVPSFGRNRRGSPDFTGVSHSQGMPAACSWYLGSEVLGCRTLRLESQSSAGLRMQPYPRAPDLVCPGHLHGTGCLCVRAMDTGFPTVVWRACLGLGLALLWIFLVWGFGLVCARVWALAFAPPLLAGACGLCVWVWVVPVSCPFWLGFAVRVFGCGCVRVGVSLLSRLSWLGLAVRVRVRVGT